MKKLYFTFIIILFCNSLTAQNSKKYSNTLFSTYIYEGNKSFDIEYANLFLLFDKKPIVNYLPQKNKSKSKTIEFVFPKLSIQSKKVQLMVEKINNVKNNNFSISFEKIKKPINGMKLVIKYNFEKMFVDYKAFVNTFLKKNGLKFTLYNKRKIALIKQTNNKLLQVAQFKKKKPCIILDFGHGGNDLGANFKNGTLCEKTVCLDLGLTLTKLLKKKGYDVFLTRDKDKTVKLAERIEVAKKHKNADFFISIHANSALNKSASGVETFYFDYDKFKTMIPVLSNVNKAILLYYYKNVTTKSKKLAQSLQNNILLFAKPHNKYLIDRKIKSASNILLSALNMPAVLVEVGFLSHEKEGLLLSTKKYQKILVNGIYKAIDQYLRSS